jgi:hypothetical protein
MAGLPDPAVKRDAWASITDPTTTESIYNREAKMRGFYSWDQLDLCRPYFSQFYENFRMVQ